MKDKCEEVKTVQVLVAAVNQSKGLSKQSNIQINAIIANQCKEHSVEAFSYRAKIKWINSAKRGVGLNRNTTLM